MRSCDEALELISAALDGALTGEEQSALDEHLSRCPACSALFAELNGLHAATTQLEEDPAPAGFAGQVMERIAADPAQEQPGKVVSLSKKKRSPWKGWAATAAVVAVVVLGAVTLPGRFGADNSTTSSEHTSLAAAPVQEETAGADFAANGGAVKFFAESTEESGAAAEPESAFADAGLPEDAQAPREMPDTDTVNVQASPADSYCGVLTLTGGPLPEGLEAYESTEDASGALTYVVPADYFFSCLTQLEAQDAVSFTYDASGLEAAAYGLIIVEQ